MGLSNGDLSAADVAAVMGNNGNGNGWNGDGSFWIVILFLFALMGGYGNGWGGNNGGMMPWMFSGMNTNNDVQRGFDQSAIMGGITGITSAISNGFANAEVSRCNGMTNILQAMNNNQNATTQGMNTLAMGLQNCCCENRAATADLKYTVATEACADRNAISSALRDVLVSNTANTQAILDKMCQQEIETLKQQNLALQNQLNMANLAASQTAQTAQILANNEAQTAALRQALDPSPIPAYVVPQYSGYNGNCNCV